MRFLLLGFLVTCSATGAELPNATPGALDPALVSQYAHELEASYFEWRLSEELLAKERALEAQTAERGLPYELSESTERVEKRIQIERAKRSRVKAALTSAQNTNSPWLRMLANNLQKNFGEHKSLVRREIASSADSNSFERETDAFLHSVMEKNMVPLRWECLKDLLGSESVDSSLRAHLGFRNWDKKSDYSWNTQSGLDFEIVIVTLQAPAAKESNLVAALKRYGFTVTYFVPSDFADPRLQAQELQNFLSERKSKKDIDRLLVSEGLSSAIVYSLLDQFPTVRSDEEILGWINLNGKLFGESLGPKEISKFASQTRTRGQRARGIASLDPARERRGQRLLAEVSRRTEVPLSLGPGFPIYNILDESRAKEKNIDIAQATVPQGKNYFWPGSAQSEAFIEVVGEAIHH